MLTDLLLPWLSWMNLNEIKVIDNVIVLRLSSSQSEVHCPLCQQPSALIHSGYRRILADLPWAGSQVVLAVGVRKFFCRSTGCTRKVFCEPLPSLAAPYARRTQRLYREQQKLGLDLGGAMGARIGHRHAMGVSATTLLRQIRCTALPSQPTVRKLGVDDWALCKGEKYGTILVDLERHQPIDLLSDRTAATLARWLQEHPGIELITRDRAKDYIEGASQGAPTAVQVADRFHLLQNVRELLEQLLGRHQAALRAAVHSASSPAAVPPENPPEAPTPTVVDTTTELPASSPSATMTTAPVVPVKETKAAQQRTAHRHQRLARYQQVRALHATGLSQRAIARQLGFSIHVVRNFIQADQFPERATRRPVASKLDPFLPYLRQQLATGQDNALQLWRDLCDHHSYTGSRSLVSRWVAHHRHLCPTPVADAPKPKRRGKPPVTSSESAAYRPRVLSARQAAWLLFRSAEELNEDQEQYRQRLCQHTPTLQTTYALAQEFIRMVRRRIPDTFDDWLSRAEATAIPELQSFVAGLRRDYAAVKAALSRTESNGQTEGQVNRLKFIKRSMYGRAKFDLLRLRVLTT